MCMQIQGCALRKIDNAQCLEPVKSRVPSIECLENIKKIMIMIITIHVTMTMRMMMMMMTKIIIQLYTLNVRS